MTPEHERLGIHFWGEERLADTVALANLVLLPGGGMEPKTERDRQIIAAFDAGQSVEELCEIHRLTRDRIAKILTAERHKRRISPEPFYRTIRKT